MSAKAEAAVSADEALQQPGQPKIHRRDDEFRPEFPLLSSCEPKLAGFRFPATQLRRGERKKRRSRSAPPHYSAGMEDGFKCWLSGSPTE